MFVNDLLNKDIKTIWYENRNSIPVLDVVTVKDYHLGRLDIFVNEFYDSFLNQDNHFNEFIDVFPIYQLVLDFNGIMNIKDVKEGMQIIIPDLVTLCSYIHINEEFEKDLIVGVNDIQSGSKPPKKVIESEDSIKIVNTAVPKLKVKQTSVKYDNKNNKIVF